MAISKNIGAIKTVAIGNAPENEQTRNLVYAPTDDPKEYDDCDYYHTAVYVDVIVESGRIEDGYVVFDCTDGQTLMFYIDDIGMAQRCLPTWD